MFINGLVNIIILMMIQSYCAIDEMDFLLNSIEFHSTSLERNQITK